MPVPQGLGNTPKVWLICISVLSGIYLLGLLFPLLGVKEQRTDPEQFESTTVKQMFRAILKNDQLLWTTISMILFMVGYCTTTSFGTYDRIEGMSAFLEKRKHEPYQNK